MSKKNKVWLEELEARVTRLEASEKMEAMALRMKEKSESLKGQPSARETIEEWQRAAKPHPKAGELWWIARASYQQDHTYNVVREGRHRTKVFVSRRGEDGELTVTFATGTQKTVELLERYEWFFDEKIA